MKSLFSKVVLSSIALASITFASLAPVHADVQTQVDGASSETAAASCYEIKQNNPKAKSGTYWLYTPQMSAPAQFYCDQETDGGGWVLIGRGREDWVDRYAGQGNPTTLATKPDGVEAFKTVQLSSQTIDALLNGQDPENLTDGLRLRRALNTTGSQWQEVRAWRSNTEQWSWALTSYAYWQISYDNPRGTGMSVDLKKTDLELGRIGTHSGKYNAIQFNPVENQGWKLGFAYGKNVTGTTDKTSYLYGISTTAGYAIPFTQAYLRPTITQKDLQLSNIADSGTSASSKTALPSSFAEAYRWRTSKETGTGATGESHTQVQAITQVGSTVFTGGDFKNLVSANGRTVEQSFLAGYDVNSGELVESFRPSFNGQVKALEALPDGKLAVGGEFTEVNGQAFSGLVILDSTTGEIDSSKTWQVANRVAGSITSVRTLHASNGYLYVGGSFTHVQGNGNKTVYSRNATRFSFSSGEVDTDWRPNFNGSVNGINVSTDGKQVFAAGYFSTLNGEEAFRLASLNASDTKQSAPWSWKWSYAVKRTAEYNYQYDVQDVGSSVWTGGSEHLIAQYTKDNFTRLSSAITKTGGDFQDLSYNKGIVYGSCHCAHGVYRDADYFPQPWNSYSDLQQINLVGAWDAASGEFLPQFNPQFKGFSGNGVWETFTDSRGYLWAGGDISYSLTAKGWQDSVGFTRFAPADVTAPVAPSNLTVTTSGGKDQLSWSASSEAGVSYQVLRNDRVVATVTTTSYTVASQDKARYFVRAVDSADNYSASTSLAVATTSPVTYAQPVTENDLIKSGDSWSYKLGLSNPSSDWNSASAVDSSWSSATTSVGWGNGNFSTVLNRGDNRPVTLYLRKNIDLSSTDSLRLSTYADDGIVVYVNGHEVGRKNMAEGKPTLNTYATSAPSTTLAQSSPLEIDVPSKYLFKGQNVIAVEVHANWKNSPNVSFDMTAKQ